MFNVHGNKMKNLNAKADKKKLNQFVRFAIKAAENNNNKIVRKLKRAAREGEPFNSPRRLVSAKKARRRLVQTRQGALF